MKHPILIYFLLFFFPAAAQTVNLAADKQKILIGEQFHLQLMVSYGKGSIIWPKRDSLAHFEILEKGKLDTQHLNKITTLSQSFLVTSWDSGLWQIPAIAVGKVKSKPIKIDVAFSPSPFDINQPYHDVKDIIAVKSPVENNWYWYLLALAIVIAALIIIFRPKKKKQPTVFVTDEGAYKTALKKLDQLNAAPASDQRIFYTELVQVFREYLQRRKNIQSFSKTTDDLAIQVNSLNIPREPYQRLVQTLRLSDLVKFARYEPSTSERSPAVESIRESITLIENQEHAV